MANMNTAANGFGSCGTSNSALACAGHDDNGASANYNLTQIYNGSSWSTGPNLSVKRWGLCSSGLANSALAFGGTTMTSGGELNATEFYNGTNWATGGNLILAKRNLAGCGTSSSSLSFGGDSTNTAIDTTTEYYNGSKWSKRSENLNQGRRFLGGVGTSTDALSFGGSDYYMLSNPFANTERYWEPTEEHTATLFYIDKIKNIALGINETYNVNSNLNIRKEDNSVVAFDSYEYKSYFNNTLVGIITSNKNISIV